MVIVVMVMVVMAMAVMVLVVEITIENRGLIECMRYEKFDLFCNSMLHMVTLKYYSHYTSLITKLCGRQLSSGVSNSHTVVMELYFLCYSCTKAFPDVYCQVIISPEMAKQ